MTTFQCSYCRGINYTDINGEKSIRIEHGNIRFAELCDCDCHAEQVVARFDFRMTTFVVVDLREGFVRFAEERGLTQEQIATALDEDNGDRLLDDFRCWVGEDIEVDADVAGPGVVHYTSDIDEYEDSINTKTFASRVINWALPKCPHDDEHVDPSTLGMEPMFGE